MVAKALPRIRAALFCGGENYLKSVACHLVSRFHSDSSLLVWAGALEYKGVQSVSCGAKAGLPGDDLIAEAIKDILSRLKEPVAIRLIALPSLSDDVFGALTMARLDLRFLREDEVPIEALTPKLMDVEGFAFDVLAQHKDMAVLAAFVDGLKSADGWVHLEDLSGGGYRLDCHQSMFLQQERPVETQGSLYFVDQVGGVI